MTFKDSGVKEKFSDATKKFSGTSASDISAASILNHHPEDGINGGKFGETDTLDAIETFSAKNFINDSGTNTPSQVTNAQINTQEQPEFHVSEPEIVSEYGYAIQSDTLHEQTTHVTFVKGKKESVVIDEVLLRGSYKHYSQKDKEVESDFVDRTSLFKADRSKPGGQEKTPYIYYDREKKKDGITFSPETEKNHEKMAYREMFSDTAGGVQFESHYTNKGKLKTDVTLSSGKERTDNKGFRNKSIQFIDKTGKAVEILSPKENEAAASIFDEETEIALEFVADRTLEKRNRFRKVEKEIKSERKKIEREIKESKSESSSDAEHYFKNTSSVFKDKEEQFESAEKIFKKDRSGNSESSIFEANTATATTEGLLPHISDEKGIIEHNVTDTSDRYINNQGNASRTSTSKIVTEKESVVPSSNQSGSTGNKNIRSVESYFTEEPKKNDKTQVPPERFMSREERLEQAKSKEKAAKNSKNKELKKAAATTAVAKMLNAKKNMQNQLGDMSGQGTGDLIKDGSSGLVQTFVNSLKQGVAYAFKAIGSAIWKCIGSILGTLSVPILIFLVCFLLIVSTISSLGSAVSSSDSGVEYDIDVTGDGFVYESLSDEEIENIITALYEIYDDMTLEQEMVLRYSLSKVGCAYDQAYHGNLTVDIFDCSSLAYRSYLQAGIDISNGGVYSAAEECYSMVQADKIIEGDLKPGDLLFYGGSDNGRYLGVYHVAIYVGKINGVDKMVEARGTSWGVVYCDVRTNNVVKIARPYE